jgi:HK97 family phage major capsid protein/HK97 family phage prohead protease
MGDTDNDFWAADGTPIAAAWHAAGKAVPASEENAAYDPLETRADPKYAMPNGTYPIDTCADVTAAANLAHHSKTYTFPEVKAHVMKALAGLSCPMSDLPDTWTQENAADKEGDSRERPPRDGLVRALPELRFDDSGTDGSPGTLTGYLAVFNDWSEINSAFEGHFMERLAPTAFDKTIADSGTRMKVTFNHGKDPHLGDKVLGIPTTLEPDEHGVRYEVPLFDTTYNRDLAPGLKAGAYGSSFRFNVVQEDFDKKPAKSASNPRGIPERTVKEVRMQEFGPVTFPAYPNATAGMRSMTDEFAFAQLLEDPGKVQRLVDFSVNGSQHSAPSRGTQSALGTGEPKQTGAKKPARLKPVRKPDEQRSEKPPMDRSERKARIEELETWIRDTNTTYENDVMPDPVRVEWDANNTELDSHRAAVLDFERRDARMQQIADQAVLTGSPKVIEGTGYSSRTTAPQQINRMSEGDIYDLNTVRQSSFLAPEQTARELKDRAKRAIEISKFPTLDPKLHEFTQAKAENLLDYSDAPSDAPGEMGLPEIARRMLVTGGPVYRRAFHKYLAGVDRTPDEARAMALGAGASGGFQIVYQLDPTIIPTSNLSVNPYREICRQETIAGTNEFRVVTSTGVTATYNPEGAEQTDGSPTLLQPAAVVQTASVFIPFSIQYGQDVGNVEGQMAGLIQDSKDDLEATQFTTGIGTGVYPQGITIGSTNTKQTASGGTFAIADVYAMENTLGPRFRPRAAFVMNRTVYNLIRAFDTSGGAGMWFGYPNPLQGGMQNNVPQSGRLGVNLLAYPTYECSAVDTAITTTHLIGILGDFNYFLIVDRIGLDIEVAPMLFGPTNRYPTGQRGLFAYWRNTSKVLNSTSFVVLKVQ